MDAGNEPYEDHNSFDPAAAFTLQRQDVAAFSVTSHNSELDERELIMAAQAEAKKARRHKLGKKEKGELADKVLTDAPAFAARLAAVLQNSKGLPTVQIEYRNVTVEADALVGADRNPTVWTTTKRMLKRLMLSRLQTQPLTVLHGVSGVIPPGRLTLLLGPPGSGKSVFVQLLSGRLRAHKGLRITGSVKYNGVELNEFVVRRTAGLVDQYDNHIPNMTVIETVNFAAACQIAEASAASTLALVDRAISRKVLSQAGSSRRKEGASGATSNGLDAAGQGTSGASLAAVEEGQPVAAPVGSGKAGDREEAEAKAAATAAAAATDEAADEELKFLETLRDSVAHRIKPYITLRLVGLGHVADTMVGNETLRGVSGGERKRVTTAEVLVGPQWAVLMDEISTGLDSATTYSVIQMLRDSCHALQRTFLVSLLQPPPEVMQLFDDLLVITDGKVLFHGPMEQALPFFATLGFACPPRKDPASFLQEVTSPLGQLTYATPELLDERGVPAQLRDPARLLTKPPTKLLVPLDAIADAFWQKSEAGRAMQAQLDDAPFDPAAGHPQALAREKYAKPWTQLSWLALKRQVLLTQRDRAYYIARVVQTVVMALVISSLYRLVSPDDGFNGGRKALSLSTLSAIYLSMSNMPVMGFVFATKRVFFKHRDNQFFPSFSYVVSLALMQVPTSLLESTLYSLIVYWVAGLTPSAGRFFIFLVTCFSASNVLAAYFRLIAYVVPSMVTANAMGAMTLLVLMLTNGFSIVRTSIPPYLVWVYWALNPLAYAIRGLAINELTAPRWGAIGPATLQSFGFYTGSMWIWIGIGYNWAYLLVLTVVGSAALTLTNPPTPQPTVALEDQKKCVARGLRDRLRRSEGGEVSVTGRLWSVSTAPEPSLGSVSAASVDGADAAEQGEAAGVEAAAAAVAAAALHESEDAEVESVAVSFTPITLVCRDLCYYVNDPSGGAAPGVVDPASADKEVAGKLQLLRDIDFFAEPGRLTALMGGSGAGKTTLMDVVAGRKTQGIIRGQVLVNGHPKVQASWSRVVGYVEQMDIHSSRITVEESLQFSARLRLDESSVSDARVAAIVRETLATVELGPLASSIVGERGGDGLSIEQRKRLSIAVELVANPSVLFMDEPTSGLDARAAAIVMRAVRNVANSNRTVVVTIHQPSMEIFEAFDQLVLMQRGGRLTYFGPLGFESAHLISYLEAQPGVEPIKPGYNPATWMLEVTGGSMATSFQAAALDFPQIYRDSSERAANLKRMEELASPGAAEALPLTVGGRYATSVRTQTAQLVRKYFSYYWHASNYSFVRIIMTLIIALIYGLVYLNQGKDVRPGSSPADISTVQNVMGLLFSMTIFLGMFNCMTVMPIVAAERVVYYRERAASMYSPWPYAMAQGVAELPYLAAQAIIMVCVSYWMVGFAAQAWRFFYFMLMFFLSITMYTFLGQFLVLATPNQLIAQLLAAALNQLFTYFNGFLVPYPEVPAGWKWMARASPTTWIIYGLATTQLGDSPVCFNPVSTGSPTGAASPSTAAALPPGAQASCPAGTVGEFVQTYFGYDTGMVWWCVLIVLAYATFFRVGAVLMLRYVSYQKR